MAVIVTSEGAITAAISTGKTAAQNAAAITAALAATNSRRVYLPAGAYNVDPFDIPTAWTRGILFGDGDATVLLATAGQPSIRFPGQGYYGTTIERLKLQGVNSAGVAAIDNNPAELAYVMGGAIFRHVQIHAFKIGWKVPTAQLCAFEDCDVSFNAAGGVVFYYNPIPNSGQQANSNRIKSLRASGDGTIFAGDFGANANDRAVDWAFNHCDIQLTGTATPFVIPDEGWILNDVEFENSGANHLIELTADDYRAASRALITQCTLAGGGAGGNYKIKSHTTGAQKPYYCRLIGNNAGSLSTPFLEIVAGDNFTSSINLGLIGGAQSGLEYRHRFDLIGEARVKRFVKGSTATSVVTAGARTYTAAEILAELIVRDCAGASRTDVLPTAALLVGALYNPMVGDVLECKIINGSDAAEVITLDPGSGGAFDANQTAASRVIGQNSSKTLSIRLTNVTAASEAYVAYL